MHTQWVDGSHMQQHRASTPRVFVVFIVNHRQVDTHTHRRVCVHVHVERHRVCVLAVFFDCFDDDADADDDGQNINKRTGGAER